MHLIRSAPKPNFLAEFSIRRPALTIGKLFTRIAIFPYLALSYYSFCLAIRTQPLTSLLQTSTDTARSLVISAYLLWLLLPRHPPPSLKVTSKSCIKAHTTLPKAEFQGHDFQNTLDLKETGAHHPLQENRHPS